MVTTGLSDDDLRETAYEVLLVSVGAAGYTFRPLLLAFPFMQILEDSSPSVYTLSIISFM